MQNLAIEKLKYSAFYWTYNDSANFIPPYSPHQFKILGDILDTIIMTANVTSTETLLLEDYKSILAKLDSPNLPPLPVPPPPPNKNQPKFKPRK